MLLNLNDDYHGYAFLDLYRVNDHFGTDEDLKSLITTAHSKDIWVMLDVVSDSCSGIAAVLAGLDVWEIATRLDLIRIAVCSNIH